MQSKYAFIVDQTHAHCQSTIFSWCYFERNTRSDRNEIFYQLNFNSDLNWWRKPHPECRWILFISLAMSLYSVDSIIVVCCFKLFYIYIFFFLLLAMIIWLKMIKWRVKCLVFFLYFFFFLNKVYKRRLFGYVLDVFTLYPFYCGFLHQHLSNF